MVDVGAVFHKLFDHRTALHAEHQFFVKEFEVKMSIVTTHMYFFIKAYFLGQTRQSRYAEITGLYGNVERN